HTAAGIPTWSPTVVLICRSTAYVWQSGRDAQFSADCGRILVAQRGSHLSRGYEQWEAALVRG
ncbi:hypothetical protein KCU73_g18357, partial [Aureobasidium melanogenum]